MKKTLPIIAILLLIGGGVYFYSNRQAGQSGDATSTETRSTAENGSFQGTLESIVSRGDSVKCEWSDDEISVSTYVKGQMVYSETQAEGDVQYSIIKDNCTWTWGDTSEQAFRFCFENIDYEDFDPTEPTDYEVPEGFEDMGAGEEEAEAPEYKCEPADVPDSMFEPPADIEFSELPSF